VEIELYGLGCDAPLDQMSSEVGSSVLFNATSEAFTTVYDPLSQGRGSVRLGKSVAPLPRN